MSTLNRIRVNSFTGGSQDGVTSPRAFRRANRAEYCDWNGEVKCLDRSAACLMLRSDARSPNRRGWYNIAIAICCDIDTSTDEGRSQMTEANERREERTLKAVCDSFQHELSLHGFGFQFSVLKEAQRLAKSNGLNGYSASPNFPLKSEGFPQRSISFFFAGQRLGPELT